MAIPTLDTFSRAQRTGRKRNNATVILFFKSCHFRGTTLFLLFLRITAKHLTKSRWVGDGDRNVPCFFHLRGVRPSNGANADPPCSFCLFSHGFLICMNFLLLLLHLLVFFLFASPLSHALEDFYHCLRPVSPNVTATGSKVIRESESADNNFLRL